MAGSLPATMEAPALPKRPRPTPPAGTPVFSAERLESAIQSWLEADEARRIGDVARFVECEANTVRSWRKGATVPDAHEVGFLARLLGKPVGYFFVSSPSASTGTRSA